MTTAPPTRTVLIVGASRGIGLALTQEYAERGWRVVATVRGSTPDELAQVVDNADGRVRVEVVDMTIDEQVESLHDRLADTTLDLLFVSGAIPDEDVPISEVSRDDFVHLMVTNVYGPSRFVERFEDLVRPDGTIAVMSSTQGSISLNTRGGHEVYRASKSALNQIMRSFAARHQDDTRTLLLVNPGHVQTHLGGAGATLTTDDSVPGIVDMIEAHTGDRGLQFRDYKDDVVPW